MPHALCNFPGYFFSLSTVVVSLDFHIGKNAEKACANRERQGGEFEILKGVPEHKQGCSQIIIKTLNFRNVILLALKWIPMFKRTSYF